MAKEWRIDDLPSGTCSPEIPLEQVRLFRFPVALRFFRSWHREDLRGLEEIAHSKGGLQWVVENRLKDKEIRQWARQYGQPHEKNFILFAASAIYDPEAKQEDEKVARGTVLGMVYFYFDIEERRVLRELRQNNILPKISRKRQIFEIEYVKHPSAPRNVMKKAIMHACVAINSMKAHKEESFEERSEVKALFRYHKHPRLDELLILDKQYRDEQERIQTSPISQIHLTAAERILTKSPVEMIIYSLIDENNAASLKLAAETGFVYIGNISDGESGSLMVHLLDWNKLDDLMKGEYGLFTKESFDPGPGRDTTDINLRSVAPATLLPNWP